MKILRGRQVRWGGGVLIFALLVLFCASAAVGCLARPARTDTYPQIHDVPVEALDIRLDINRASWRELTQLEGIGKVLARRILDYRSEIGGFTDIEQIKDVYGIGEGKFAAIRDRIKAEPLTGGG